MLTSRAQFAGKKRRLFGQGMSAPMPKHASASGDEQAHTRSSVFVTRIASPSELPYPPSIPAKGAVAIVRPVDPTAGALPCWVHRPSGSSPGLVTKAPVAP